MGRATLVAASVAVFALAELTPAAGAPAGPKDPSLAGFPPGYIEDCATRPRSSIVAVPAPFNRYMRVVCTRATDALAPLPGFGWHFTNGTSGFLTAINPKTGMPSIPPSFTRLANAPVSAAEAAGFRARLKTVIKNPAILAADILRLEVDTTSGDHKQEYYLIGHGANAGQWGVECYNDCDPIEATPWAFTVVALKPK